MNDFLYKFFLLNIQLFYDLTAKIEANAGITELIMLKFGIALIKVNYNKNVFFIYVYLRVFNEILFLIF